jgi:cytochrome P450
MFYVCRSEEASPDNVLRDGKRAVKRYLPFSEGPRSCAGMSLAKVNMTATLASLLGNFSFQLADEVTFSTSNVFNAKETCP